MIVRVTGTLGLFSLADLFQLLSSSGRSGRLTIDHPEGTARLYFEEGKVVHAEFGSREGEEAVFALFADEQGSFEFVLGVPPPRVTIQVRGESLLLEATRRFDERTRDSEVPVDPELVPSFASDGAAWGDLRLARDEVQLLRHIDGRRSVGQAARSAGLGLESARSAVSRLVGAGILRLGRRSARTARLVVVLSRRQLPDCTVEVDSDILESWSRNVGKRVESVACRLPDGKVCILPAVPAAGIGPYLGANRDTLLFADLHVDQPLLVRPYAPEQGR